MRNSIRLRVTVLASISAALVLTVAGLALVLLQRSTLTSSIDQALRQRADDVATLVASGALPEQLPTAPGESFAQVVDADGGIISASPNLSGAPPVRVMTDGARDTIVNMGGFSFDDDVFRVLGRMLPTGATLIVGTTYEVVAESTRALVGSLALLVPLVLLALGWLTWWLVGRTLEPVEAVEAEVAEIGSTDLHRRVPLPGTRDEIDRLANTMNEMLGRLEASVGRQQRFIADASHELRTPLTRLHAELELRDDVEPQDSRRSDSLLSEVVGMQDVVEDLLFMARVDSGQLIVRAQPIDFDDIVLDEAARLDREGHISVDVTDVSAVEIVGDRRLLARAVANVAGNARRHADTTVIFTLRREGHGAVLTIADDGPGVAMSMADVVFQRFSRVDEARTPEHGGTGLGLAIALEIAQAHGGALRLSNPGEPGAVFELRLPIRPSG